MVDRVGCLFGRDGSRAAHRSPPGRGRGREGLRDGFNRVLSCAASPPLYNLEMFRHNYLEYKALALSDHA